jgi:hypothetical protein
LVRVTVFMGALGAVSLTMGRGYGVEWGLNVIYVTSQRENFRGKARRGRGGGLGELGALVWLSGGGVVWLACNGGGDYCWRGFIWWWRGR